MRKILAISMSLLSLSVVSFSASGKLVDKIVAIVNDQIVTITDADEFRKSLSTGGMVDDALIQMVEPKKLIADREALLNFLVDEKVLDSEVKKKNLEVTVERVEQEIRDLMKKRG